MSESAFSRGARGGVTVMVAQAASVLVQILSVLILSRLLPPSDFGLIAMVAVVVGLSQYLRDFGLSTASARVPSLTQSQASNLFWVSSGLAVGVFIIVAALAPVLAAINQEPRLLQITPAMALVVLFNGIQTQFQVQLVRNHRYLVVAWVGVGSNAVSLIAAIVLALAGAGYWSLVVQATGAAFASLVLQVVCSQWRPSLPTRSTGTKTLISDGFHYGAAGMAFYISSNADTFFVGALWGAGPLGLYNRAYQLIKAPVQSLLAPLFNVAIPTVNAVRQEGGSGIAGLMRVQTVIGVPLVLLFSLLTVSSTSLVPFILGEEWMGSVAYFQILAIASATSVFARVAEWCFVLYGRPRIQMRAELMSALATVVLVALGALHSPYLAAWGVAGGLVLRWWLLLAWLSKTSTVSVRAFISTGLLVLISGAVAATVGLGVVMLEPTRLGMFLAVGSCLAAFVGLLSSLPSGRQLGRTFFSTVRFIYFSLRRSS